MKKLTLGDFKGEKIQGNLGYYLSFKDEKNEIEVCLESCFGGYCVAIYDFHQNLIGEKECTNINLGLETQVVPEFLMLSIKALKKAVKIANKKYKQFLKDAK